MFIASIMSLFCHTGDFNVLHEKVMSTHVFFIRQGVHAVQQTSSFHAYSRVMISVYFSHCLDYSTVRSHPSSPYTIDFTNLARLFVCEIYLFFHKCYLLRYILRISLRRCKNHLFSHNLLLPLAKWIFFVKWWKQFSLCTLHFFHHLSCLYKKLLTALSPYVLKSSHLQIKQKNFKENLTWCQTLKRRW